MRQLIDATKLDTWFVPTSRRAQELLPHLVRRLIYATKTLSQLEKLRVPVGDEIGLPGFDGEIVASGKHFMVPEGRSIWEMGVGDPAAKATEDFNKRTRELGRVLGPTFVFVTPHVWPSKGKWLATRRAEGKWRQVEVIDAVDLGAWIETAPSVGRWMLGEMGYAIEGLRNIDLFLGEINALYGIDVPPELVIGGREKEFEAVRKWIESESVWIDIDAESNEEAAVFIAACVKKLPEELRLWCESRILFTDSPAAVENATTSSAVTLVVPTTDEARRRAKALKNRPCRVLSPRGRSVGNRTGEGAEVRLGTIRREACENALLKMGIDLQQSRRIATECKGRLSAVMWMVAEDLQSPPAWANALDGRKLIPLMLAGQWAADHTGDRSVLEKLSGSTYATIEMTLAEWTAPRGALVRRGGAWDWLAWDFAWKCLASFLTRDDIQRFRDSVKEVLTAPDPKLEVAEDKRWAAAVFGREQPYSSELRSGLIGSIVHFALDVSDVYGNRGQDIADVLVRDLFAGKPDQMVIRYLSLAPWLPDLAEAAPDEFLKGFSAFLLSAAEAKKLFQEEGIFGSSRHVYVLWALERLAWSVEFFARAIILLGRLTEIDPGGKLSNRPLASLTHIFLPWRPQTSIDIQGRLDAIDLLHNQMPAVAWQLCVTLLPNERGFATPSAEPQWHGWKFADMKITWDDYWKFTGEIIDRMLGWAGSSGESWRPLLKAYIHLISKAPSIAERIRGSLNAVSIDLMDREGRRALSDDLREFISRNRDHADMDWALKEQQLEPIDQLYLKLRPADISDQNLWLFAGWPTLRNERSLSYEQRIERLTAMRAEAVQAIWQSGGQRAVFDFAERIDAVEEVGRGLSSLRLDLDAEGDLMEFALSAEPQKDKVPIRLRVGIGYTNSCFGRDGSEWLMAALGNRKIAWDAMRYANLGWGLPTNGETWDRIKVWGAEAERLYWQRFPVPYLHQGGADLGRAVRELLNAGRPYRAISLAGLSVKSTRRDNREKLELPTEQRLIIAALERAPSQQPQDEWYPPSIGSLSSDVEQLLGALEHDGVDQAKLASLEWLWLPALEHGERGLKSLQNALSESPQLFVDILSLVFRSDDEEPREATEDAKARAMQAYRLLHEWQRVPGTVETEAATKPSEGDITFPNGTVDYDRLHAWVLQSRQLANEKNRLGICDTQIGHILAYAPQDQDGSWPCESVRKLLEEIRSKEIDRGVEIGVFNKRGAHFRGKGGDQERLLRDKFHNYSTLIRTKWPFTAAILDRISDYYEREARREDDRADLEEFE